MATFLDVTALEGFSNVFVFLLVAIGGYAVLIYLKPFGQNNIIYSLMGIITAFFVIMSPLATLIIKSVAPFLAVILTLVSLVVVASGMFGHGLDSSFSGLRPTVFVILIIVLIVGTLAVVRKNIDVPERGEDFGKISTIIFHPNFLGLIFIFALAIFTVALLAAGGSIVGGGH